MENDWLMYALNEYRDSGMGYQLCAQHGVFAASHVARDHADQKVELGLWEQVPGERYWRSLKSKDNYIRIVPVTKRVWI